MSAILNVINYFWKLGFAEEATDTYTKTYSDGATIRIDIARETFDFGNAATVVDRAFERFSQRNFVVMESIDRVLRRVRPPPGVTLGGETGHDYFVCTANGPIIAVRCCIWEDDYDEQAAALARSGWTPSSDGDVSGLVLYTSRLKAGIIEHRLALHPRPEASESEREAALQASTALFGEEGVEFQSHGQTAGSCAPVRVGAFTIRERTLVGFHGAESCVVVPEQVERLKNAVFWGQEGLLEVVLPVGLRSLGGDTFYNCTRLERVAIPAATEIVGDNPFANCPALELENRSPHFRLEGGLLLDRAGTRLIYCAIRGMDRVVVVPDGVFSVGKHAFYNCQRLERIVLPPSVRVIENNPFSNLPRLRLENRSPHFVVRDGALYNKTMGTLFYYEQAREADTLLVPEGVRIIGRHSFYNCSSLRRLVIPSSVTTIGYNPFAGCSALVIENRSPAYRYEDGALYDREMTELIHYTVADTREEFAVPASVRRIGRSAFFGARHLRRIRLPVGLVAVERSAFAHCHELREIKIPATVPTLGEWAFSDCPHLEGLVVPAATLVEGGNRPGGTSGIRRQDGGA